MKKSKKNFCFFAGIFVLIFMLIDCKTNIGLSCPYEISNPHVEIGDCKEKHKFAGMYFSLFNESNKTIDTFTISFMLYDSDGNNPFVGSNCIVSKIVCEISPNGFCDFVIDLDSYISIVPTEPYLVDYIYIREIKYTDGTKLKDPYGMYCIRENYE